MKRSKPSGFQFRKKRGNPIFCKTRKNTAAKKKLFYGKGRQHEFARGANRARTGPDAIENSAQYRFRLGLVTTGGVGPTRNIGLD